MSQANPSRDTGLPLEQLKFDHQGLITAVVQDAENGDVLMVGYMNREAIRRTLESGQVTFWSRSRQRYWVKGETSGHTQTLRQATVDCDQDCLLLRVVQQGPACHEGYRSCFFRELRSPDEPLRRIAEQLKTPEEMYGRTGK